MFIDQCKDTDYFLKMIDRIDQQWARKIGKYAFVGDNQNNMLMIHEDNLDKSKFEWRNGKIIPLTEK